MNHTTTRRAGLLAIALSAALFTSATPGSANGAPNTAQEQMIQLPGGDLHVVTSGTPTGDPVVLIHGLAGSTAWWDPIMPALQDRYVIRIDLLGHGASDKPDNGYGIDEQATRVAAALDRLGVHRAVVAGHSTGGYVATALAEQRPDLVAAIVLLDTGSRLDAFTDNGPAGDLVANPAIGGPLWPLLPDIAIRYSLSSAFTRDVPIPDRIVADVRGMTYRGLIATSNASDAYLRDRDEPDRLAALNLPAMLIYGTGDKRWQPASYQDYARVPGIRVEPLSCGHTPMIEDPQDTGPLLHDFAQSW